MREAGDRHVGQRWINFDKAHLFEQLCQKNICEQCQSIRLVEPFLNDISAVWVTHRLSFFTSIHRLNCTWARRVLQATDIYERSKIKIFHASFMWVPPAQGRDVNERIRIRCLTESHTDLCCLNHAIRVGSISVLGIRILKSNRTNIKRPLFHGNWIWTRSEPDPTNPDYLDKSDPTHL